MPGGTIRGETNGRFAARFDGAEAWADLGEEQRRVIGAIALEVMVNWHGMDRVGDFERPSHACAAVRPFEDGDPHLLAMLENAAWAALPEVLAGEICPVPSLLGAVCRVCGCSEHAPCEPPCAWAERDLCTACAA